MTSKIPAEHGQLILDLFAEINDPDYVAQRHGERNTRNKGCTGPLCQKAIRDQRMEYRRRANKQRGLETRRYARSPRYVVMDPILTDVKLAYDKAFDLAAKTPAELQTAGAA